jgi:hypothetical protein
MKTVSSIFLALALLLSVTNCISAEEPNPPSGVQIRIANASSIAISDIDVRFPSQEEKYGALEPGASSEYRDIAMAFRYASVTVKATGQTFSVMAIDYMGEKKLEPGLYTYTLNIHAGALSLGLLVDKK